MVPKNWKRVSEGDGCGYKRAMPGILVVMEMFHSLTVMVEI